MIDRKELNFLSRRVKRGNAGTGISEYEHKSNGVLII